MVFVNKSLPEMLAEINCDLGSSVDYVLTAEDSSKTHFVESLKGKMTSDKELELLAGDQDVFGLVTSAIENSYARGYLGSFKPVLVEYFFGNNGVVAQVTDNGIGFDVDSVVEAFKEGTQKKGVHYKSFGIGLRGMNNSSCEVNITSSAKNPSGTTVTIMYKI